MNTDTEKSLPSWLPLVVGAALVVQFAALGAWQISRGLGKLEAREAFETEAGYANFYSGATLRPYQPTRASGRLLGDRQFLLDNIILNSRYGYYVLTPLELAPDEPLLMVNRGWIEKSGQNPDRDALRERIDVPNAQLTVHGRAGSLPKAGMRMGNAVEGASDWPIVAVYPATADLAAELGRPVHDVVLLMDPEDEYGFLRHWVPQEMGPGKHFGYALQWFAMGAVLTALLVWHYRKNNLGRL